MDNTAQGAHLAAAHGNSDFVFIFTPIHTVRDEEQNVVLHAVNQDQANWISQVLGTGGLRFVCLFVFSVNAQINVPVHKDQRNAAEGCKISL